jgi:hypothetical protein
LNSFIFGKSSLRYAPPQLGVKQQLLISGDRKATRENKIKPESKGIEQLMSPAASRLKSFPIRLSRMRGEGNVWVGKGQKSRQEQLSEGNDEPPQITSEKAVSDAIEEPIRDVLTIN